MGKNVYMGQEIAKLGGIPFEIRSLKEFSELLTNARLSKVAFNFVNVHSFVESSQNPEHFVSLTGGAVNLPDGAPIAYFLSRKYGKFEKLSGPNILQYLIDNQKILEDRKILLFGGASDVLKRLETLFDPKVVHVKSVNPGNVSIKDIDEMIKKYKEQFAWADFCFVGLGCPKQELLCREIISHNSCLAFGFGAAFDFVVGAKKRAPKNMQQMGLEWLHRLVSEPKRLFFRYLKTNTIFLYFVIRRRL